MVESPPLPPGVYDVRIGGRHVGARGEPSRELLPRRADGAQWRRSAVAPSLADAPLARELGWLYVVAVLALCAEWLLRRKLGLR